MIDQLARPTNHLLTGAGGWFLSSGIQDAGGGLARYYRSDLGTRATLSTEITGYAVSALLFFHQRLGQAEYLESALRAARFLTRTAWDPQLRAFPFEYSVNGHRPPALAYFFDTGIVIRGLLAAWRVSGQIEFREIAIQAGHALLADFSSRDGFHPIVDLPEKRALSYQSNWSAAPGCYQLKAAMSFYQLFEATGNMCFRQAYESAVDSALSSERDFLPGDDDVYRVMDRLHAYAYFLEGLVPMLRRGDCARAFREGMDRMTVYLRQIAPLFVRSDVCAQLLRLRLYGHALGVIRLDAEAAKREARDVASFQLCSQDPGTSEGFCFGRKHGEFLPFVNPVSTAFGAQTLALWDDYGNHALEAAWDTLI
jgi:hypothetical protein